LLYDNTSLIRCENLASIFSKTLITQRLKINI